MRSRLGSVNLLLLSSYFFPVWGREAYRALASPYHGLENRGHAAAAAYFDQLIDLGANGLMLTSHVLAGVKLVIAAAFASYVIEFARACVTGRDTDRDTIDVVLILASVGVVVGVLPALALGDEAMIRLQATHMLLVAGAITVFAIERQLAPESPRVAAASAGETSSLPVGVVAVAPPAAPAAVALARIPDARLRSD